MNPFKYIIVKDSPFGQGVHNYYRTLEAAKAGLAADKAKGWIRDNQRPEIQPNPHYTGGASDKTESSGEQPRDDHGRFASK